MSRLNIKLQTSDSRDDALSHLSTDFRATLLERDKKDPIKNKTVSDRSLTATQSLLLLLCLFLNETLQMSFDLLTESLSTRQQLSMSKAPTPVQLMVTTFDLSPPSWTLTKLSPEIRLITSSFTTGNKKNTPNGFQIKSPVQIQRSRKF